MDENKDEAAICLNLAESALLSKHKQSALKFIRIVKRLDPTISTDKISAACWSLGSSIPFLQQNAERLRAAGAERSALV